MLPPPRALPALLLPILLMTSTPARAGGFTIPVIGSRAGTIGGFVARADDTSAIYHNPAGLGLLGDYQIDLSGTAILSHTNYSRCTRATFDAQGRPTGCAVGPDGEILFEKQITTIPYAGFPAGFGMLPYLGLSGRFGLKNWNFGLAVYSPHNATGAFPDCQRAENGQPTDCSGAPQRFHAVLGTINTIYIAPGASWTPHPDVHIGLGFAAVRAAITSERSLWLGGPNSTAHGLEKLVQDWGGEGRLRLDASAWSWNFSVGVIWQMGRTLFDRYPILRGLKLGFSFYNMTWFTFRSDVQLWSPLLYSLMKENQACRKVDARTFEVKCATRVDFTFPLQIRPGIHWQLTREWGVGFELFWQNYQVYDQIKVELVEPLELLSVKVNDVVEPKNSTNSITISTGFQYSPRYVPGLELRLGFMWDESPYPDSTYSLLSPDADKAGVTIGVSYLFKFGLEISAAYLPIFYMNRIVRDSVLRPSICKPDDAACQSLAPDAGFSMNGDVKNKRVDMFTLQLGWRFGEQRL